MLWKPMLMKCFYWFPMHYAIMFSTSSCPYKCKWISCLECDWMVEVGWMSCMEGMEVNEWLWLKYWRWDYDGWIDGALSSFHWKEVAIWLKNGLGEVGMKINFWDEILGPSGQPAVTQRLAAWCLTANRQVAVSFPESCISILSSRLPSRSASG